VQSLSPLLVFSLFDPPWCALSIASLVFFFQFYHDLVCQRVLRFPYLLNLNNPSTYSLVTSEAGILSSSRPYLWWVWVLGGGCLALTSLPLPSLCTQIENFLQNACIVLDIDRLLAPYALDGLKCTVCPLFHSPAFPPRYRTSSDMPPSMFVFFFGSHHLEHL